MFCYPNLIIIQSNNISGKIKNMISEIMHNPCYKLKSCKLTIEHEDSDSIDELVLVNRA